MLHLSQKTISLPSSPSGERHTSHTTSSSYSMPRPSSVSMACCIFSWHWRSSSSSARSILSSSSSGSAVGTGTGTGLGHCLALMWMDIVERNWMEWHFGLKVFFCQWTMQSSLNSSVTRCDWYFGRHGSSAILKLYYSKTLQPLRFSPKTGGKDTSAPPKPWHLIQLE